MNEQGLSRLREFLFKEFNEEQLAALCQEIGLTFEELPGEGMFGKTRGIIEVAQARDLIPLLMSRVRDLRPAAYHIAAIRRPGAHSPVQAAPPIPTPLAQVRGTIARPLVILFIIIACVVMSTGAVALNQLMLNQRTSTPAEGIAAVTGDTSALPTATAIATPSPTNAPAVATDTPPAQPTATMEPTGTPVATATPLATPSPTPIANATTAPTVTPQPTVATPPPTLAPSPTATLSPTASALQAVLAANELLAAFYSGQANGDALRAVWAGDTYSFVIAYPTKSLKRNLGVDVRPGEGLTATLRYVRELAVLSDNGSRMVLTSREYWTYKVGESIACETVDYSYTVAKVERYQIVAYKGDVISANTASGCE